MEGKKERPQARSKLMGWEDLGRPFVVCLRTQEAEQVPLGRRVEEHTTTGRGKEEYPIKKIYCWKPAEGVRERKTEKTARGGKKQSTGKTCVGRL